MRADRRHDIPTIYGNYDYAIARNLEDCGCAYVTAHDRELGQRSVEWTLAHTSQEAKDFMRGLPFDLHFPDNPGPVSAHSYRQPVGCARDGRSG